MPTVSVIIPNYNHGVFLDQRICSVLNQTYRDYEVIILDDCSEDNSREIIERYRLNNKVTNIVFNKTNSGSTFKQWERGIQLAKGRFVWIAESDDYADERFLETLLKGFDIDPKVVCVTCNSIIVDEHGEKIATTDAFFHDIDELRWRQDFLNSGEDEIERYLTIRNTIPNVSAVVFSKAAFDGISDSTFKTLRLCGDWLFYIEVIKQGKIFYNSFALNYYREHGNTVRNNTKKDLVIFVEYLLILSKLKGYRISTRTSYKKRISYWYYLWYLQYKCLENKKLQLLIMSVKMPGVNPYLPIGRLFNKLF